MSIHTSPNWAELHNLINQNDSFWLTTHQNPDGDGLGAELALSQALDRLGKKVRIINANALPERYAFLESTVPFECYEGPIHDAFLAQVDVAVLLDACRVSRVGPLAELFSAATTQVCIDHHPSKEADTFHWSAIDTQAAATGQLVYEGLRSMGMELDQSSALGAYVALVTDSGSFRFSNADSRAHRVAADLLEHDLNPAMVFDAVFGNWELGRLRLMGHAFSSAEVRENDQLILIQISKADLQRLGATPDDAEGLVDFARNVRHCEVVACILETEANEVRVSLRSKGRLDVSPIAKALGGGGHPYASGAKVAGTLDAIASRVGDMIGLALGSNQGGRDA